MKKIAIITGAAGGIGQIFVRELTKEPLDEIWVIGRNEERLHALKKEFGEKIVPLCKDLTVEADVLSIFFKVQMAEKSAEKTNIQHLCLMKLSVEETKNIIESAKQIGCSIIVTR